MIYKNLTELIGNTPLLELTNFNNEQKTLAKIIAKLEYFNPAGSIKDRIGYSMIKDAEEKGYINQNTTIIEPTSGNTGIGLAFVAAAKKYKLIIVMPDTMSMERRSLLKALGVELVLTPGIEGMKGAINKANEIAKDIPNSFVPLQFKNLANPQIHRETTVEEIWRDTEGKIDFFVSGVGTGGTITGVGEILKKKNPNIKIIAVEPSASPVLSGGQPAPHKIQGIGAGFIPDILNMSIIDEIIKVDNEDAFLTSKKLALSEGLLVGISSGATAYAALQIAKRQENANKNIVVIFADSGERYLSTTLYQ